MLGAPFPTPPMSDQPHTLTATPDLRTVTFIMKAFRFPFYTQFYQLFQMQ